jgi:hypothetical protein
MAFNEYIDKMVCGVHFDGSNGQTTLSDVVGNSWSGANQFSLSTGEKKFGTASGYFTGDGGGPDKLELQNNKSKFNIGWGDFTISMWVKIAADSGGHQIFTVQSPNFQLDLWMNRDTHGCIRLQHINDHGVRDLDLATADMGYGPDAWHFIGVKRSGSSVEIWADGVLAASTTMSDQLIPQTATFVWMHMNSGYLDDFQFYKGVALDLSVVPTEAFSDEGYPVHTSFLTHQGINAANQAAFINIAGL